MVQQLLLFWPIDLYSTSKSGDIYGLQPGAQFKYPITGNGSGEVCFIRNNYCLFYSEESKLLLRVTLAVENQHS